MKTHLAFVLSGLLMGVVVSFTGVTDYGELHRMTTLADLRLFYVFAGAVALLGVGYRVLGRGQTLLARPFHPGAVPGGILFGVGWALTGGCPTMATVQLGEGQLPAAVSLAGMATGIWLYGKLRGRVIRWETPGCDM